MENISAHISYAEAVKSATAKRYGKDNTPNAMQLANMKLIASKVFEPVRTYFGKAIAVTSFFRSLVVNVLVGGVSSSKHCTGEAMDIDADILGGVTNAQLFHFIKDKLDFDQLIWEFGDDKQPDWIHVSYLKTGNRRQVLRSKRNGSKTEYTPWNG